MSYRRDEYQKAERFLTFFFFFPSHCQLLAVFIMNSQRRRKCLSANFPALRSEWLQEHVLFMLAGVLEWGFVAQSTVRLCVYLSLKVSS